jgi:hypothetical protein
MARRTNEDITNEVWDLLNGIVQFKADFFRLPPKAKNEILDLFDAHEGNRNPMEQIEAALTEWLDGGRV